ncbi:45461_t:CDS:1, partial [Gigaspora margarita]
MTLAAKTYVLALRAHLKQLCIAMNFQFRLFNGSIAHLDLEGKFLQDLEVASLD